MKLNKFKSVIAVIALFFIMFSGVSQNSNELWSPKNIIEKTGKEKLFRKSNPLKSQSFHLNFDVFKNKLKLSPNRKELSNRSKLVISFPNETGVLEEFEVVEASIMDEKLQKRFPSIKSYSGISLDGNKTIRFSITNLGLNAMILDGNNGATFIDSESMDKSSYLVYSKKELPAVEPFECKFDETDGFKATFESNNTHSKTDNANDGKLRTFRLAVATTGEYSQFHLNIQGVAEDATEEDKKAAVLSAIVNTMTRVNGIYERDIAITMELVANNTNVIYLDGATDPFTNNNSSTLIDESQTVIDNIIGSENYDIGHTFSTGGGGLAQLNSPCTSSKARGITGTSSPVGDPYDVDYVSHEMGHQFGATHTFNNSCNGNRSSATSVEPGSGSTIMAYAGICAPNVQNLSDSYFHLVSIRQMWNNITNGNSDCGVLSSTNNSVPVIEEIPNYFVPISTPFSLNAVATDVDADNLTYTWEQLDPEPTTYPLAPTSIVGPSFRSLSPSDSSQRFFPNTETVLSGDLSNTWEVLPSVSRTMSFGVNVRDNQLNGGQTASKETTLTFDANAGPFKVTSQTIAETWNGGTSKLINWDVANTDLSPVNCTLVNILLSTDGGYTYPYTLASNVNNDGSYQVIAPNITASNGRIKVESVGNVFYAINSAEIEIIASNFTMTFADNTKTVCEPASAIYNFTYNSYDGFNEEVAFSAEDVPSGATISFNPATAVTDGTNVELTVSGLTTSNIGSFDIGIIGTSTSITLESAVILNVYSTTGNAPVLTSPENNVTGLLNQIVLTWEESANAESYNVQVASDSEFSSIIVNETVTTVNLEIDNIETGTQYYWRVKSINLCGETDFSNVFSFETQNIDCQEFSSVDVPKNIPDNSIVGVTSKINFSNILTITDVNVTVNITHPWIGDLELILISPEGTQITLVESRFDEGDNYTNTVFDDEAVLNFSAGSAPYTGSFKPQNSLELFNNENSFGEWILKAIDNGPADIGTIDNWSISICGIPNDNSDDDGDGVLNGDDACPNTPSGETVNAEGCSDSQLDDDGDGVVNGDDVCANTPNGETVNAEGCSESQLDDDKDGVMNNLDVCANTPSGETVNAVGCSDSQLDDDNDGVLNDTDECPNTTAGLPVNAVGCFILDSNNFSIETIGESCTGENNGQVVIVANSNFNYIVTINEDYFHNFNDEIIIDNLTPGTYNLCITIDGEDFEQCYTLVIEEAAIISGKSSVASNKASFEIETGTAPYIITINEEEVLKTNFKTFDIAVKHGDYVEVKTSEECEGVLSKSIDLFDQITAYPNPTSGGFEISLPFSENEAHIQLYNIHSQLILAQSYKAITGKVRLNIENFPTGIYIAKVILNNKSTTLKILKN